jgi:chitin disaccharide deacetylase
MTKRIDLIADDFGLSPSVSSAILELALKERLSGVGCMVIFPDWLEFSHGLRDMPPSVQKGLHLTLTDFPLSGKEMPAVRSRIVGSLTNQSDGPWLQSACDWQLERFIEAFGAEPDFIDGHQHVHLLPQVRNWIIARFSNSSRRPWVRGTPQLAGDNITAVYKSALLRLVGRGHSKTLRDAGFCVAGPLLGFYDWKKGKQDYAAYVSQWLAQAADGAVIMCHPGHVDDILLGRDSLTDARQREFEHLDSDSAKRLMDEHDCRFFGLGERQSESVHE